MITKFNEQDFRRIRDQILRAELNCFKEIKEHIEALYLYIDAQNTLIAKQQKWIKNNRNVFTDKTLYD